jgi:nicotinamidase-related amidase
MSRHDTGLLIVDVQEKLLPLIANAAQVEWNVRRLLDAARCLSLLHAATEQYPQGLGPTLPQLRERLGAIPSKRMFSCRECHTVFSSFAAQAVRKILVAGIETHVCIQQTVLDLLAEGFRVYLAVDAMGSRSALDHDIALRRMDSAGAVLTTTEAALFEWCETTAAAEFKQISGLVRESAPK